MTGIPIYDATVPIACTADREEISARIETVERMRANLRSIERTEDGLLLAFPADPAIEAEIRRFAVEEKGCCQFWGFEVEATSDAVTLRWDGPPGVAGLFEELLAFFQGDEPLTALSGLL